jgi:hypothetical protein
MSASCMAGAISRRNGAVRELEEPSRRLQKQAWHFVMLEQVGEWEASAGRRLHRRESEGGDGARGVLRMK